MAGEIADDYTVTWNDYTSENAEQELFVVQGDGARYLISIANPSPVTAISMVVQVAENAFAGNATLYCDLTDPITVPAASAKSYVIEQGWLVGAAGRLQLNILSALEDAEGFSAIVRIRKRG